MRVLHSCQPLAIRPRPQSQLSRSFAKRQISIKCIFSLLLIFAVHFAFSQCDNVINGGLIEADEFGCPNPTWDPSLITNVEMPMGGTGALEFIWIYTTDDPSIPSSFWNPIVGSNSPEYDPGPISETTYFRRCVRRAGCTDYLGESNIVMKEAICCDNVTDGGQIAEDQVFCEPPYDPALLTNVMFPSGGSNAVEYQWIISLTGSAYNPTNPDWTYIIGEIDMTFDPGSIMETTYYIRLSRRHGCLDYDGVSNMITVVVGEDITVSLDGTDASCQGANDGSIMLTNITGGTPNYTYEWVGVPGQTDPEIFNLWPATFELVVTDSFGCTGSSTFTINEGPPLTVETSSTDITCLGNVDGTATVVQVADGIGPFGHQWDDNSSQTDSMAIGLSAGQYNVVVTDSRGCIGTGTATINDAVPINLSTFSTDATCDDSADGTASAQVLGGISPYQYLWSDPASQTTATAINLPMGSYSVTVTDANGCTETTIQIVSAPMQAEIEMTGTDVTCFGANDGVGEVSIINDDINNYAVLWDNVPPATTPIVNNLSSGNYNVTVTNAQGCTVTGSVSISEPNELSLVMDSQSASCFNSSDGTAIVFASGGTPFANGGYLYSWDAIGNPTVQMLDDVSPGIYAVTVTDANSCTAVNSIEIQAPDEIQLTFNPHHVTCNGLSDGSVSVAVSGGIAPYTYLWDDPANSTGTSISDLSAGVYSITVTDANSCISTGLVNITEPLPLSLSFNNFDVVCVDDTDGVAVAVIEGGTGPYDVLWDGGQTLQAVFGLGIGTYIVSVTDFNGCFISGTTQINSTTTLSSSIQAFDAACFDLDNGVAIASGVNGTLPYSYQWSNGQNTAQISALFFGSYDVTVTDGDGCTVTNTADVNAPPLLTADIDVLSEILTFGGTEGSLNVTASGGVPPYGILWSNGETPSTIANLGGGIHSVTITDANFCTRVNEITLIEPSKIGDYIWNDDNQNGIQDTIEVGLEGIVVHLTGNDVNGQPVDLTTESDSTGYYAFDGLTAGLYTLNFETMPNHVYTYQNVGNDFFDSDADSQTGMTQIFNITQGEFESKWDCGMIILDEKIDLGDKVWYDVNHDGLQGLNEGGVEDVIVRLIDWQTNNILEQTITDKFGFYLFEDIYPGQYVIEFVLASLPPGGYIVSPKDQGNDDTIDSDADIFTGKTDPVTVLPFTLDNLTIDAGIYLECDNITDGGVIGYDEDLCGVGADPSEIVNVVSPSGGYGNIEYLWMKSVIPIYNGPGDPNWVIIPNSNSPTYDPGPIGASTYYIRCARREGCDDYIGESNVVSKTITPYPLAQIIDAPNLICMNEGSRFEAAIAGAGASYQWTFAGGGNPSSASTRVVEPVSWSTQGVKTVTLTVTRFGCSFSATSTVIIDNCTGSPLIAFDDVIAELQGDKVRIDWLVNGNTDHTIFTVQSSEDGQNFRTIGLLSGEKGSENSSYQIMDNHPRFGENIYRIKYEMIAGPGQQGYSNSVMAMFQPNKTTLAQVYPNPTSGKITVELLKANDESALGEIRTAFGKVLSTFEIPANTEKLDIDLSNYSSGMYMIVVQQAKLKKQVCKVFKAE